ncbi:methyltransferase [Dyella sp.]|uniref:methyltransferase n=1 Tax=Dyella sp. TaxID=1869338 RepID=UPI002B49434F|nr:methyltransferase [Dyella sp.]HKT28100.1 methyltransferase [Dyella sp.]
MLSILQLQQLATCNRYNPAAYLELCRALVANGQLEAARTYFNRWQYIDPDNPVIGYQRSLLLDADHLSQLPLAYVANEFDKFADSFDRTLGGLNYSVPSRFAELLYQWVGENKLDCALDLGCGTGLCGMRARRYARSLWGVDVSAGMLAKSRLRGVYDRLVEREFHVFLEECESRFDLILAGDSLIYIGDLRAVLGSAARALMPNGLMLMSFEEAEDERPFRLPATLRFKHARSYVENTIHECGMRLEHMEQYVIRTEGGMPVPGLIILARGARVAVDG